LSYIERRAFYGSIFLRPSPLLHNFEFENIFTSLRMTISSISFMGLLATCFQLFLHSHGFAITSIGHSGTAFIPNRMSSALKVVASPKVV
jgi:hypothetical protein